MAVQQLFSIDLTGEQLVTKKIESVNAKLRETANLYEKIAQLQIKLASTPTDSSNFSQIAQNIGQTAKAAANLKQQYIGLSDAEIAAKLSSQKAREAQKSALRDAELATIKGTGSYRELSLTLNKLREQFKGLTDAQRQLTSGKILLANIGQLDSQLKQIDASLGNFQRNVGNYKSAFSTLGDILKVSAGGLLQGVASSLALSFAQIQSFVVQSGLEVEKLKAILNDDIRFEALSNLNKTLPGELTDLVETFNILSNSANFQATEQELIQISDFALKQGKSIQQFVEAIADSTRGENTRLQEFGVAAEKSGDKIIFTFKGVSTEVNNSSQAITKYLIGLGNLNGIQGTSAKIAAGLAGSFSNFKDTAVQLASDLAQSLAPAIKTAVGFATGLLGTFRDLISVPLSAKLQKEQTDFSVLASAARSANLQSEERVVLVNKLIAQYPEQFKGLSANAILESELNVAITAVNNSLKQKILLQKNSEIRNRIEELNLGKLEFQAEQLLTTEENRIKNANAIVSATLSGNTALKLLALTANAINNSDTKAQADKEIASRKFNKDQENAQRELRKNELVFQKEFGISIQQFRENEAKAQADAEKSQKEAQKRADEQLKKSQADVESAGKKNKVVKKKDEEEQLLGLKKLQSEADKLQEKINSATSSEDRLKFAVDLEIKNEEIDKIQEEINTVQNKTRDSRTREILGAPTPSISSTPLLPVTSGVKQQSINRNKTVVDFVQRSLANLEKNELANAERELLSTEALEKKKQEIALRYDILRLKNRLQYEKLTASQEFEVRKDLESKATEYAKTQRALTSEQGRNLALTVTQEFANFVSSQNQLDAQRISESANRQIQEVEARFDKELELAKGNSALTTRLEKEKADEIKKIRKKEFEEKKKLDLLAADIALASGLINIAASPSGLPLAFDLPLRGLRAATLIATTIAQKAIIKERVFAEKGGLFGVLQGKRHSQGGIPMQINGQMVEAEDGEWFEQMADGSVAILSRKATANNISTLKAQAGKQYPGKKILLSNINSQAGGVKFAERGALIAGQSNVNAMLKLSDTDIKRIADAVRQGALEGASAGSAVGTETGATKGIEVGTRNAALQAQAINSAINNSIL